MIKSSHAETMQAKDQASWSMNSSYTLNASCFLALQRPHLLKWDKELVVDDKLLIPFKKAGPLPPLPPACF